MSLLGTSLASSTPVTNPFGSQSRHDSLSPGAAMDRFQFEVTAPSSFYVSLYSPSSATTVTLIRDGNLNQIVDAGEILQSQTTSSTTPTHLEIPTLNAGTYYLIVTAPTLTQSIDYTLRTSRTADINTDLLWRNPVTQQLGYWRFDGTTFIDTQHIAFGTTTNPWQVLEVENAWDVVGIGDFNGDRIDDFAWRNRNTHEVAVWVMGQESPGLRRIGAEKIFNFEVDASWHFSGVGDLDGDGKADWIWRNPTRQQVAFWLMDGINIKQGGDILLNDISAHWALEGVADFDGNGKTDLLWRNQSTLRPMIWSMNGPTLAQMHATEFTNLPVALDWRVEGFGDFSGDGKADILWRNPTTGALSVWLVNGTQIVQTQILSVNGSLASISLDWQVIGIDNMSDRFTGNRNADIVWRQRSTGKLVVWEMNGVQVVQTRTFSIPALEDPTLFVAGTTNRPARHTLMPLDTTPPVVTLALESDTGIAGDHITRIPTITGQITDAGSSLKHVFATLNNQAARDIRDWITGTGTVTLSAAQLTTLLGSSLSDRAYSLTIRATDLFGNLTTTTVHWTLDTTAPSVSLDLADETDTGRSTTDHRTRDRNPRFSGTAEAGVQVELWLGTTRFTTTATTQGTWQISPTNLIDGIYQVKAVAIDAAGNRTEAPLSTDLVIDTQAPTAPTNLQVVANPSGEANRRTIAGVAEADATVRLFAGAVLMGETRAAANGSWQIETAALNTGSYAFAAVAIDAADNESGRSSALTIAVGNVVLAPQNLRLTPSSDRGSQNNDQITNLATPEVIGTAQPGTTVKLYRNGLVIGQATTDSQGNWTIPITISLPEGTHDLVAIASNGTEESAPTSLAVTIDGTQPTFAVDTWLSGVRAALSNGMTLPPNTRLVGAIDGTGSAIAHLSYRFGTTGTERTIPVSEEGLINQVLDLSGLSNGTTTLRLTVTDVAGNVRTVDYDVMLNLTQPPEPPTQDPAFVARLTNDSGKDATDGWTDTPEISGFFTDVQVATEFEARLRRDGVTPADAPFFDIRSILATNGTFSLDAARLGALLGEELSDGQYTLQLRSRATHGQWIEQAVTLKLDQTAPTTQFPNLIDGIAWERGTGLQGEIEDESTVDVTYRIETTDGTTVVERSTVVTDGSLNQALPELAAGNETLEEERPYQLVMTSTDQAGNQQRSRFQFFLKSDRKVVDDDPWTGSDNPPPPPSDAPEVGPGGTFGGGGGTGGGGGGGGGRNWIRGFGGRHGNGGGNPPPDDELEPPYIIGDGYDLEYEYTEGLSRIVEEAVKRISTHPTTIHKKGALDNRARILDAIVGRINALVMADGDFRNDQALIDRFAPTMEQLFLAVYDPRGEESGIYKAAAPWLGSWLAYRLVTDDRSVRVQIFQASVFAVMTEALIDRALSPEQQDRLVQAINKLGQTYAWLNPDAEAIVPPEDQDFAFLNRLWRLQMPGAGGAIGSNAETVLSESVAAVRRLFANVQDPVKGIEFLTNLVEASTNAIALKQGATPDIRKPQFLRELKELGFEIIKVNPTTTTEALKDGEWIEALWRGTGDAIAQQGLHDFFSSIETTAKRIELLDYAERLIQAMQQVQNIDLQVQKEDARFLSQLLNLGSAYVTLDPAVPETELEEPGLFLRTLWSGQNIEKAAQEVEDFLAGFDDPLELIRFQTDLCRYFDTNDNVWTDLTTTSSISEILGLSGVYVASGALQRGPRPGSPSPARCREILHDIVVYMMGGILERLAPGKEIKRGQYERYWDMRNDNKPEYHQLYRNHRTKGEAHPAYGSWMGHKEIYEEQRGKLQQLLNTWDRDNCPDLDKLRGLTKKQLQEIIAAIKKFAEIPAPEKPDDPNPDEQPPSPPSFSLPDFNPFKYLFPIFERVNPWRQTY